MQKTPNNGLKALVSQPTMLKLTACPHTKDMPSKTVRCLSVCINYADLQTEPQKTIRTLTGTIPKVRRILI